MLSVLVIVLIGLNALNALVLGDDLAPPVRLEAAGKPIDTDTGHAAPFVCDFDGDGVKDLLVGQFMGGVSGGSLLVFHNEGTNMAPKFAAGVKFKQGSKDGSVPSG